jgi:hypothetical protein
LISGSGFSQAGNFSDVVAFSKNVINKPIAGFKDSVVCNVTNFTTKKIIEFAECRAFQFESKYNLLFRIGDVEFEMGMLLTDTMHIIQELNLYKSYWGTGYSSKKVKQDFLNISSYFNDLLKSTGSIKQYDKSDYFKMSGLFWQYDSLTIGIERFDIPTKKNRKKSSNLTLYFR